LAGVLVQLGIQRSQRRTIIRALKAEISENLRRIGVDENRQRAPLAIERSAWDAARSLALPDPVTDAIQAAYAIGADLSTRVAIVDSLLGRGRYADPGSEWGREAGRHHNAQVDELNRTAKLAHEAFVRAQEEVAKL